MIFWLWRRRALNNEKQEVLLFAERVYWVSFDHFVF